MGLGKERSFSLQHFPEHLVPLVQKGVFSRENAPLPNVQEQRGLGEVRIKLKEQGEKEPQIQPFRDDNGFEPFTNPSNDEGDLFVNRYGGNYYQDMELNRKTVEKVLKIAHLNGRVFLSSRGSLPKSPIELNPDGSVTAKRTLSFEQKIEEEEGKNLFYRVESVPQGWNIVVNDKIITDELTGKRLSGDMLKRIFIEIFNGIVKDGLFESIRREKLSSEKDGNFKGKLFGAIFIGGALQFGPIAALALGKVSFWEFALHYFPPYFGMNALVNIIDKYRDRDYTRKLDSPLEYFAPFVEVDKVIRTYAFLKDKGRILVREKIEEKGAF